MKSIKRMPLHQRVSKELERFILTSCKPGDRLPPVRTLKARMGVSDSTLRAAVAMLQQSGMLEPRHGSGVYVLDHRPEKCVGVLTELDISHPDLSPFYPHVVQAVRRRLTRAGIPSRFYMGHEPPFGKPALAKIDINEFWADLRAGRLSGLILVGTPTDIGAKALAGHNLPFVGASIGRRELVDYGILVRMGIRHLLDSGRARVACIDFSQSMASHPLLDLFQAEARREGLQVRAGWTASASAYGHGQGGGAEAFRRVWSNHAEKPDGLLVLDDMLYRDIAPLLLHNRIQVPEDLLVVSHMNAGEPHHPIPMPVGLEVHPDDVADVLVRQLIAKSNGEPDIEDGVPVPIRLVTPVETNLTLVPAMAAG